ncbi:ABC transporter ATP-binding protein [Parapedobacter koreensis]|uniref:ATP-binding cassette, subfamily B, MsbA n=1 Tax=Parapedobacter koreensis TaxID=332977 RepID=A0A1H7T680_9SPHI|nr:ABC transporter ATP-binding protein [Parapedobacter koreensis]SEL80248.1 ATP-binding cassette, subfamily B, MsbA [Parapedobacter koreensis]
MSKYAKDLIRKYFTYFVFFYIHLRHRIFIALSLSLFVGILDGFGLAMFFPLLEMIGGDKEISGEGLGGLNFLISSINAVGISLTLYSVLIIIAFLFTLKGIAKFCEQYYSVITQQYFIKKLRYESINKLSNLKYKSFVTSDVGRIQNTLSGEVGRVSQAYRNYFLAVQSGVMVSVYAVLALLTDPQFAVLVLIGGGLSNLVYNNIYKRTKATSKNITKGGHIFQGLLIQQIAFFKYLKATGYIRRYANKLKDAIDYIEQNTKRIGFYNAILAATREPLVIIVVVLVIIIQVTFFSENIGAIILSLMFFYRSLNALMQLQNYWNSFLNMSGSLTNTTAFMKELAAQQERTTGAPFDRLKSAITLSGVQFSYNETPILSNIDITISKNSTVAFVGESGSGKTTLVNILAGLMPIEKGNMLVDGVPLNTLNKDTYHERVGYITQEPVIFSDTIYNNVTFWADDTLQNRARFWEALEKSAIADFVRRLPQQENAPLGNNGILVSGGQKQRLSIARELYKEVDILIMDEATSALDSETERAIQENIEALKGKYTILIVAHRLSTIRNVDLIVLLQNGKIQGIGDYEALIDSSPAFKKMVALQEI